MLLYVAHSRASRRPAWRHVASTNDDRGPQLACSDRQQRAAPAFKTLESYHPRSLRTYAGGASLYVRYIVVVCDASAAAIQIETGSCR